MFQNFPSIDSLDSPKLSEPYPPDARQVLVHDGPRPGRERLKAPVSLLARNMAYGVSGVLVVAGLALAPYVAKPLTPIPGFVISYATGLSFMNILVAVLLLCKARIEGKSGYILLATAYLYAGFIIIPHVLAFPDAIVPGIVIGSAGSAVWLWAFWHGGFAALVIRYCLMADRVKTAQPRIVNAFLGAVVLDGLAAYLSICHLHGFPAMLKNLHDTAGATAGLAVKLSLMGLNILAAVLVVGKFRLRNAEDLWLAVGMIGACVEMWLTLGAGRFCLGWYSGRICGISTVFLLFASLLNDVLRTYGSVAAANDALDRLTFTDALTELGNRRLFDDALQKEWRRCHRENAPLTVVMLDVDEFKAYNDNYGHPAGDACLRKIAAQLQACAARPGDVAARYGGEEFAFILPATDSTGGGHVAKSARRRVRDMSVPHPASANQVITISAGVATLVPSDSSDPGELLRLADTALYEAKHAGRDRIVIAS